MGETKTTETEGEMVVAWWNGGGKLIPRLNANPELQKYMSKGPDMFVYGEALVPKITNEMRLPGYNTILHKAQPKGNRRGIMVYYKQKHAYAITKENCSKTFDILWLRMKSNNDEIMFGFFYAPGEHKTKTLREKFYDELRRGIDKHEGKKIYILGDSNARLGEFSGDKNIHGTYTSNNNKPLFMGLIQYTGLEYLNRIYEKGTPTYEIWGQKRSIIDTAMTNNISQVKRFKVYPKILGTNAQTCHKIIELTLQRKQNQETKTTEKALRFRHCSDESLMRVRNEVARKCKLLRMIRGTRNPSIHNYSLLRRLYHNAKVKCIGFSKRRHRKAPVPMSVKTVQAQIIQTTSQIERELRRVAEGKKSAKKPQELIEKLQRLEKELYTVWSQEKQISWAIWVKKLNKLDHSKATRAFYTELKRKNSKHEQLGPIVNEKGQLSTTLEGCMANWRNFYKKLYSKNESEANTEEKEDEETSNNRPGLCKPTKEQEEILDREISMNEVVDALFSLKTNTTAGKDSILARDVQQLLDTSIQTENWKNVELLKFLHITLQSMWKTEKVKPSFKETVIRPFLKDLTKTPTDPLNYRPVALLNTFMKIYEHIIKERLVTVLEKNKFFSNTQAAYRKGRATVDHILVVQELFYLYRYKKFPGGAKNKRPLYLCLMDLAKAFDTVPRKRLFEKLWRAGIRGKMYRVIKDLYTNNKATIKVGGHLTKSFEINSGVMQGSKLGPILFNIFINDLLKRLQDSGLGVALEHLIVSALGFADDVLLIADDPAKLQALINICGSWSRENGMRFNIDKCKVLPLNVGLSGLEFRLMEDPLKIVRWAKYLGIILSRGRLTTLYGKHIQQVLEKAEARANTIRHLGYNRDGLRPQTSIAMYKTLVRPTLEYAAQALSYKHYYFTERKSVNVEETPDMIKRLERFQNKTLKKLVSSPKNTPPAVVRIITGTMAISARIDILKLRYFWRLMQAGDENIAHVVYKESRQKFLEGSESYIHEIFNTCCKYGSMGIWHGQCPKKVNPLARIKRIVEAYHLQRDLGILRRSNCAYSTLRTFKDRKYSLEPWLQGMGRFASTKHRRMFLYALLDVANYNRQCVNCEATVKDITSHGLKECPRVEKEREIFRLTMRLYNAPKNLDMGCKSQVMIEALVKKSLLKVLCDFLIIIWNWDE